ncbi:hypothetical protein B7494_g8617 [Chlorociboria aeruginascens]|nr:hypothetical protein B7494_g8617 [Chlorociboria aeruginascens]
MIFGHFFFCRSMRYLLYFLLVAATTVSSSELTPKRRHSSHARSNITTSLAASLKAQGFSAPTFFEPFLGVPNTLPSSENWIFDLGTSYPGGTPQWGNNEVEIYTDALANIHITANQTLEIIPQRLSNGSFTSARIETQRSNFSCAEGGKLYIESRIKLGTAPDVHQQGICPAFWATGSRFRGNYSNWPSVAEWDILEVLGGNNLAYSTVHCGYSPGGPCRESAGIGSPGTTFTRGDFHTVGFMVDRSMCGKNKAASWLDETLSWYLDEAKVFGVTGAIVGDEEAWDELAHGEKFLLLNVAVGGYWPGPPNDLTIGGEEVGMEVEYVGVWNTA